MILSCQNICKAFGEKVILNDASFHIEHREKAPLILCNCAGKTTLLRDMIRSLSDGAEDRPAQRMAVVDERGEVAGMHHGTPQLAVGCHTDVLDGCKKTEGIRMLLRSMSPQILAVDELGGKEDFAAVKQALCCGCRVLGTVHAGCVQELLDKPYLQACVTQKLFGRYILIERNSRGERSTTIYDERMERIC